jgi:hypothetical protein
MKKYGVISLGLLNLSLLFLQACKAPSPTPTIPPPIQTSTPTPMPTSCQISGPPQAISTVTVTVPLNLNDYVAYNNGFSYTLGPHQTDAQTFNNFSFYAANSSGSSPATFELAVFNQYSNATTQQVLADSNYVLAPSASGWFTANLSGAVTDAGTFNMVAHALSPGLSIGTVTYSYPAAGSVSGNYAGYPLPPSLQLTPTWTDTGFAINLNWCSRTLTNGY